MTTRKRDAKGRLLPRAAQGSEDTAKPSQASRFADDARRLAQPRGTVETPLMYARRIAGWPRLKEKSQ